MRMHPKLFEAMLQSQGSATGYGPERRTMNMLHVKGFKQKKIFFHGKSLKFKLKFKIKFKN